MPLQNRMVIETLYGKQHKYEIVMSLGGIFSSTTYSIYRDGQYFRGSFNSLIQAIEEVKKEA